ncbi:hypothetical protein ACS0TY_010672 [Phlomoides rotata]
MINAELLIKFLEACTNGRCLIQLHSITIKSGLTHNTFFAAKLIDLYSRFANLRITRKLFDDTPNRALCNWNRILKCYCRDKQYKKSLFLFSHLFSSGKLDLHTIQIALKACAGLKALDFGNIIHAFVRKSDGIGRNLFVGSALIELYSKCGKMDIAVQVFEEFPEPDTVLWTTIITGYEQNRYPIQALDYFARMAIAEGVTLDPIALISAVSACTKLLNLKAGRSVHGYMIRVGLQNNLSLLNSLLNLYGKTGSVNAASNLFIIMEEEDVISWGSMIACYAHHGCPEEALNLFNEMVARGIKPNVVVLFSALQACEATYNLEQGIKIHILAVGIKLDSDILVSTALIDMYMNCCSPDDAIEVFDKMPERDAFCYSALMHGCVQNGEACVLHQTSCIHGFAIRAGLDNNVFFGALLVESYAKCGSLDDSIAVFAGIGDRDIVIWSSMLAVYGYHGKDREALELFHQMIKHSSVRPNDVLFLSLLSACSHAGLVQEGIEMFNTIMKDYNLTPNPKHYAIVVDLLGRNGELDKAT